MINREESVIVSWVGLDGSRIRIAKGSLEDMEFRKRLHEAGLWEDDDPNKPEGCISMDEYLATHERGGDGRWRKKDS